MDEESRGIAAQVAGDAVRFLLANIAGGGAAPLRVPHVLADVERGLETALAVLRASRTYKIPCLAMRLPDTGQMLLDTTLLLNPLPINFVSGVLQEAIAWIDPDRVISGRQSLALAPGPKESPARKRSRMTETINELANHYQHRGFMSQQFTTALAGLRETLGYFLEPRIALLRRENPEADLGTLRASKVTGGFSVTVETQGSGVLVDATPVAVQQWTFFGGPSAKPKVRPPAYAATGTLRSGRYNFRGRTKVDPNGTEDKGSFAIPTTLCCPVSAF